MFGIGFPEMLVILAVALIVVGPDKLPDLARSLAKGMVEFKRTMNQVKHSLTEENDLLGDVQDELRKAAGDVQEHLLDTGGHSWRQPQTPAGRKPVSHGDGTIDMEPVEERPWEADRLKVPPASDEAAPDETADSSAATDRREDNNDGTPSAPAA